MHVAFLALRRGRCPYLPSRAKLDSPSHLEKIAELRSAGQIEDICLYAFRYLFIEEPENQRNLTGASPELMFECVMD